MVVGHGNLLTPSLLGPYSHFRVGACLLLAESPAQQSSSSPNLYVTGSNVEIASTPVGICAERCALAPCVASFTRPAMPVVRAVAVSTDISPPSSPCGMCRQFLREFCASDVKVYMYGVDNGKVVGPQIMTMGELLPMSFGPNDLEKRAAT